MNKLTDQKTNQMLNINLSVLRIVWKTNVHLKMKNSVLDIVKFKKELAKTIPIFTNKITEKLQISHKTQHIKKKLT